MIVTIRARGRSSSPFPTQAITITTQPSTAPVNNVAFAQQPAVTLGGLPSGTVVTASAMAVDGQSLIVASMTLGGTLTAATNGSGVATFTNLKLTGFIVPHVVVFTAAGFSSVFSDTITPVAGTATKAGIRVNPAGALTGVAFITQPIIELQDASGNATGTGTTDVVAAKASGSGTLSGTATVACVAGVATFTNLVLTGSGAHTLSFTPTALTLATSTTVTVSGIAATALQMVQQPAGAVAATPFTTQPTVRLIVVGTPYTYAATATENPLSDGSKWTIPTGCVGILTTGGTFQATNTATNFNDMYVNSTGLTTVSSDQEAEAVFAAGSTGAIGVKVRDQGDGATYLLAGGPADNVVSLLRRTALLQQSWLGGYTIPGGFVAGTTKIRLRANGSTLTAYINDAVQITATDTTLTGGRPGLYIYGDGQADSFSGVSLSENVAAAGVSVAAAKHAGVTGTLSGTTPVTTDANGLATFTNLQMSAAESGVTLDFTSAGLTTAVSSSLIVASGAATQLVVTQQPLGAVISTSFGTQPSVERRDAGGVAVLTSGVTITASLQSGTGALAGTTTAVTNGSGVATWTNLSVNATGAKTLRFTEAALTVDTTSFTVASSPGLYPNRPSNYNTVLSDYPFSDTPPVSINQIMGSGWWVVYNSTPGMTKVSDGSAPVSPSDVLQWRWPNGHASGGGVGHCYMNIAGTVSEVYVAFSMWHDASFEWNTISNKMLYLEPGNILIESKVNGRALAAYIGAYAALYYSTATDWTLGGWNNIEVQIKRGLPGLIKVWKDGTLVLNQAVNVPTTTATQGLRFDSTWGGLTGPKTRESTRRIDNVFVATP